MAALQALRNEFIVENKYKILLKIDHGSFGVVYKAQNITNGDFVAVKLEPVRVIQPLIHYENKILQMCQNHIGFPRVRYCGQEKEYNIMIMDLLGDNLETLFEFCGRKFSIKTVLMLAMQMLNRVEYLHCKCYIHRDIKPENFLIGLNGDWYILYMIDFGLAKKYRDTRTHVHILYREDKHLTGTARYASINAHIGLEQSRRDDLESLGYVLMYFNKGKLPWQGLTSSTRTQKYEKICEMKISVSVENLCAGFPAEFCAYLNYCRNLRFEDAPDYQYLRYLFELLFRVLGYRYDYKFDWLVIRKRRFEDRWDLDV